MKCQKNDLKNTGRNFERLYKRLIINNIVKPLMNVRLTILGLGLLCDEGGEACPKKWN